MACVGIVTLVCMHNGPLWSSLYALVVLLGATLLLVPCGVGAKNSSLATLDLRVQIQLKLSDTFPIAIVQVGRGAEWATPPPP